MFGLGGFLGGVSNLVGDFFTGGAVSNARAVEDTNALTERLSSTAYQRGMADMKAAGLNPMLAYSQGGASSPQMNPPRPGDIAGNIPGVVDKLAGIKAVFAGTAKTKSETLGQDKTNEILEKRKEQADHEVHNAEAQSLKTYQEYLTENQKSAYWKFLRQQAEHSARSAPSEADAAIAEAQLRGSEAEAEKPYVNLRPATKTVGDVLGIGNSAKALRKGVPQPGSMLIDKHGEILKQY